MVKSGLTYALLAVWASICLFPLYWAAATSLKGALEIVDGPTYFPFLDYTPSLDAWPLILLTALAHRFLARIALWSR